MSKYYPQNNDSFSYYCCLFRHAGKLGYEFKHWFTITLIAMIVPYHTLRVHAYHILSVWEGICVYFAHVWVRTLYVPAIKWTYNNSSIVCHIFSLSFFFLHISKTQTASVKFLKYDKPIRTQHGTKWAHYYIEFVAHTARIELRRTDSRLFQISCSLLLCRQHTVTVLLCKAI